jgi:hypothetical protein
VVKADNPHAVLNVPCWDRALAGTG